jgi:hypothetical protein
MRLWFRRKDVKRQVTAGKKGLFESTLNTPIAISTNHRIPFPQSQCSRRKPRKPKHLIQSSSNRISKYISLYPRGDDEKTFVTKPRKHRETVRRLPSMRNSEELRYRTRRQENCVGYTNKGNFEEFFGKMLVDVEDGRW